MTSSLPPSTTALSYKAAGVDIDAGDALVERIKPLGINGVAGAVLELGAVLRRISAAALRVRNCGVPHKSCFGGLR